MRTTETLNKSETPVTVKFEIVKDRPSSAYQEREWYQDALAACNAKPYVATSSKECLSGEEKLPKDASLDSFITPESLLRMAVGVHGKENKYHPADHDKIHNFLSDHGVPTRSLHWVINNIEMLKERGKTLNSDDRELNARRIAQYTTAVRDYCMEKDIPFPTIVRKE